jgi:hypothetical protein
MHFREIIECYMLGEVLFKIRDDAANSANICVPRSIFAARPRFYGRSIRQVAVYQCSFHRYSYLASTCHWDTLRIRRSGNIGIP